MTFVSALTAESEHVAMALPIWAYGVIPLVTFAVLAFVIWNYRNVANRHAIKADAYKATHVPVVSSPALPPHGEH